MGPGSATSLAGNCPWPKRDASLKGTQGRASPRGQEPRCFLKTRGNSSGPYELQSSLWGQLRPCSSCTTARPLPLSGAASFPLLTGVHTRSKLGTLACNKWLPGSEAGRPQSPGEAGQEGGCREQEQAASRAQGTRGHGQADGPRGLTKGREVSCLLPSGKLPGSKWGH